jgi:2-C-methyl-D-erythritol 4-phosphate cytidylyltransferase
VAKKIAVIICAAGQSSRFGGKTKKTFTEVNGKATFMHSVELFADRPEVKQVILAIHADDEEWVNIKYGANLTFFGVKICQGGDERFETVDKALKLVKDDIDLVAVHDAARCCVTTEWIDAVFAKAAETGAAMLAAPVVATIKKVEDGVIKSTVDRTGLYEAQTPQVFDRKLLTQAYEKLDTLEKEKISDDSQLIEAMGKEVHIVETDQSNIKITQKTDIHIAQAILKSRPKPKPEGYESPFYEAKW